MTDYIAVRSSMGYKVHAVRADTHRAGYQGRLTSGPVACGKIKGRDAWAMPTLHLLFDGQFEDNKPLPFTEDMKFPALCTDCVPVVKENTDGSL